MGRTYFIRLLPPPCLVFRWESPLWIPPSTEPFSTAAACSHHCVSRMINKPLGTKTLHIRDHVPLRQLSLGLHFPHLLSFPTISQILIKVFENKIGEENQSSRPPPFPPRIRRNFHSVERASLVAWDFLGDFMPRLPAPTCLACEM